MKIKIIANRPKGEYCSGIEHLIGEEFTGHFLGDDVVIRLPLGNEIIVFAGEYEIIEAWKEHVYGNNKTNIKNRSIL